MLVRSFPSATAAANVYMDITVYNLKETQSTLTGEQCEHEQIKVCISR